VSDTKIRATWIKAGMRSMAHMRLAATTGREDTPAMRWGRLVHMAVLEPLKLAAMPRWDGGRRAGKAWDEFNATLAGREHLTADDLDALAPITEAASRALRTLPRIEATEVALEWSDAVYGPASARLDAVLTGGGWLEVKTAADIEVARFAASAYRLGYHLQLGWYGHGARLAGYVGPVWVLAIESKPPHTTALLSVSDAILAKGYEQAEEIARAYRACEATDCYPGPHDGQTLPYELPTWAEEGATVDMEGMTDE
jgi:hypothetical protein